MCRTPQEVGVINIEEGQLGKNFEAIFAAYIAGSQEICIKDPNLIHTHQVRLGNISHELVHSVLISLGAAVL